MTDHPRSLMDPQAERELLGTCIANPALAPLALEKISADRFSVSLHAKLFSAIEQILAEGKKPDEFALDNRLSGESEYTSAGGLQFVIELSSSAVLFSPQNAIEGLAESVQKTYQRRQVQGIARSTEQDAENPLRPIGETIISLREKVTQIEDDVENSQRAMIHVAEITRELQPILTRLSDHPGEMLGFSTGFRSLDRLSSGFPSGSLTILAARPSVGKTAFGLDIALRVSQTDIPVAVFSLETPRDMLQLRLVCRQRRINLASLTSGHADAGTWRALARAIAEVSTLPIYVDDRPRVRAIDLRWRIRAAARRFKTQLVIIDYLQLATGKGDTRNDEVTSVSGELQAAARELGHINGGALLVLSQLNRLADGERPRLSNLRDSGAIEQDADSVWFLCDTANTLPGQFDPAEKQLEIAKSRNGPTGTVRFEFFGQCMAFEERTP